MKINAQDYMDLVYGVNKERDSKPEHKYYLGVIQDLLNQRNNVRKRLDILDKEVLELRLLNIDSDSVSLLPESMEVIDDYLNAGCKESRREASKKAKKLYEKYTGEKYKNRNER